MKIINFFLLVFLIISCKKNNIQKKIEITSSKIEWNKNDELPSIKLCDEIDSEFERSICFKKKLTNLIYENIDISGITVRKYLNDTLYISILIDKSGKISMLKSIIKPGIIKEIPNIESILNKAVNNLPIILPATKTNLGVQVSTSFDLPIILTTKN